MASSMLALDGGADALARERAAVGHGPVAAIARPPGPGTAEGEAADGAADEGAEQVGMARVAGQGAVALEGSDGGVPDVLRDQPEETEAEITSRPLGPEDLRPYWRTSPVDGVDDEVADAARAPEALGAFDL